MHLRNINTIIFHVCCAVVSLVIKVEAAGRPPAGRPSAGRPPVGRPPAPPVGDVGPDYGPQDLSPKPYSFNYEVKDEQGNIHYRREEGDPSGTVMGSYGYMNVNGLFRSVEYIANAEGYKAKIRTNEPGVQGPGSADVDLQAEPVPPGLQEMFERKAPAAPAVAPPAPGPRQGYMKG